MGVSEFSTQLTQFNQGQLDTIQTATNNVLAAVNQIKNTDLSQVSTKIGIDTDTAAALTLFGKIANINTNTGGLAGKIGTNADASGTTTVFARLAQIAAFVDTLETLMGLNSDASGTTTVFARLAQIVASLDSVRVKKLLTAGFANGTATGSTWYSIASVSGKGALYRFSALFMGGISFLEVRITIDGVATTYTNNNARPNFVYSTNNGWWVDTNVYFDTSLLVEIRHTTTSNSLYGTVDYGLV